MAVLTVAERTEVLRGLMRWYSQPENRGVADIGVSTKNDLYNPTANTGAIADTDNWIDGNSDANITVNQGYNNTLPATVRNQYNATAKTIVFIAVAARRLNKTALERVLGVEVD